MLGTNVIGQDQNRLDLESNFGNDRIPRLSMSKAFNPPVRSGTFAEQSRFNQDLRSNDRVNMSGFFKPFGLQTRNTTLGSIREENVRLHQSTSITSVRSSSNVSTESRTFGLGAENIRNTNIQNNSRLNQDVRNNRSSFVPTSFGLQMRSLSALRDIPSNDNSRFNQDSYITNYRSNEQFQTSNTSRIFGPAFRNTTLTNGLQIQERCNDEIDNGGFRVPSVPRLIRGRNPITSSRIFSHQSIDRCKNLSNINGFDVSHISRRDVDTMSESRLGLIRSGWMDKQSISGSIYSTSSVKAQAMNLLENLHYSILNMGPYISVDAVAMEIEKAKQGLDNICEMSFAPSVREADAVSVISQSSRFNCPAVSDQTRSVINGECLNLKSSKEVLKSLTINNTEMKSKSDLIQIKKKSTSNTSTQNIELDLDQDESCLVFKKPKPFIKEKKSSQSLKIRTPPVKKSSVSKVTSKLINLKQWYPIAVGDDLALCGINEQGVTARTEAVKKRINNRKVELINGLCCNLIGSPSRMASALPENIAYLIRNGLTNRWRVLQKKLLNCQTAEEKKQKRKSKTPGGTKTPEKKIKTPEKKIKTPEKKTKSPKKRENPTKRKLKSPNVGDSRLSLPSPEKLIQKTVLETGSTQKRHRTKVERKKLKFPKAKLTPLKKVISKEKISNKKPSRSRVISSPKKKGNDVRTRSGRTVKPPSMFWIGKGSSEKLSVGLSVLQEDLTETPLLKQTESIKKSKKTDSEFTRKTHNESHIVNSTMAVKESSKKLKVKDHSRKKLEKLHKEKQEPHSKKETPEVVKMVSSTEESIWKTRSKRKRDPNAETESAQRKKSKIDSLEELEVESTVTNTKATTNKQKQKKTQIIKGIPSPKSKAKQLKKKKNVSSKEKVKSSSANTTETKYTREIEEDFELQLDDIEIPQFGNLSGNPQLSRSQLRLVSAETPPLKYFNSNLKVLSSATPMRSPDWVISQRTESEVKQFQKRRAEAFKKKREFKKTEIKKTTVVTEKTQSRDLKRVLEWVAEKTVQSPQWSSKVLQYVLPGRRQLEQQQQQQQDEEEDEEDENEFV